MRTLKIFLPILFAIGISSPLYTNNSVYSQAGITDAPVGYDNQTNGMVDQATHEADMEVFAEQEFIEERDVLLAVVHGYGPQGRRNEQARQSYLLKNAVGAEIKLTPFKEAIKMVGKYKNPPRLRGDAVSETLDNNRGLLYYTGAKYAWHRLGITGP